jgi:hypothetical protein
VERRGEERRGEERREKKRETKPVMLLSQWLFHTHPYHKYK